MKSEEIKSLFSQFEAAASELEGIECWSARELQALLGYSKWENFEKVIHKAKDACRNAGELIENHFPDIRKMVEIGSKTERPLDDIALTRYACYLIAQNGDSRKEEIAFAQNYFAVQTRRAEIVEQRILEFERIKAREKLSQTEKQLSGILYERGGGQSGVCIAEMTGLNVQSKDLKGQVKIEKEHIDNNLAVRNMLTQRGIVPENLTPAEDVRKLQRKLDGDEKKVLKGSKKKK
jgi:DNA-damage-inducible protein D